MSASQQPAGGPAQAAAILRRLPGLATRLLEPDQRSRDAVLLELDEQLDALCPLIRDETAAPALLSNAAARSALLTVLAVALRQPLNLEGAQGRSADERAEIREQILLRGSALTTASICCELLLACKLPPRLAARQLGFALLLLRTQPLQCCARRLAAMGPALLSLGRDQERLERVHEQQHLSSSSTIRSSSRTSVSGAQAGELGLCPVLLALEACTVLRGAVQMTRGMASLLALPDGAPPLAERAQLRQELAAELQRSGVLEHAARSLLLRLGMRWEVPGHNSEGFERNLARKFTHALADLTEASRSAAAGGQPALAAALLEAVSGRCVGHLVLVLGVATLCAGDGGSSYGLPSSLLRRAPLLPRQQGPDASACSFGALRGAPWVVLDPSILENVVDSLSSGVRAALPGPDGALALLLRVCRLLIESSRVILVAQRGSGVSEGTAALVPPQCGGSGSGSGSVGSGSASGGSGGASGGSGNGSAGEGSASGGSGNGSAGEGSASGGSGNGSAGEGSASGGSGNGSAGEGSASGGSGNGSASESSASGASGSNSCRGNGGSASEGSANGRSSSASGASGSNSCRGNGGSASEGSANGRSGSASGASGSNSCRGNGSASEGSGSGSGGSGSGTSACTAPDAGGQLALVFEGRRPLFDGALAAAMRLCFPARPTEGHARAAARLECWQLFLEYARDVLPLWRRQEGQEARLAATPLRFLPDPGLMLPGAPLPASPPPPWALALAAGWLPCLELLLRRGGEDAACRETSLACAALLPKEEEEGAEEGAACREAWRHLAVLLAYGEPRQAAALVATLGELLRAASAAGTAQLPWSRATARALLGAQFDSMTAARTAAAAPAASGAGGWALGGAPGAAPTAAGRQLALMVSYAACSWLPPLARIATRALEAAAALCARPDPAASVAAASGDDASRAATQLLITLLTWLQVLAAAVRCEPAAGRMAAGAAGGASDTLAEDGGGVSAGGDGGGGGMGWRQVLLTEVGAVPMLGAALHLFASADSDPAGFSPFGPELPPYLLEACCAVAAACPLEVRAAASAAPPHGPALAVAAEGGAPALAAEAPRHCPWRPQHLRALAERLRADGGGTKPEVAERAEALAEALQGCEANGRGCGGEGTSLQGEEARGEVERRLALAAAWRRVEASPAHVHAGISQLASALTLVPAAEQRGVLRTCSYRGCVRLAGESEAEAEAGLLACGRCGAVRYCCGDCQAADWRAGHGAACVPQG
ncbi:hypothetical protein TSOC_006940 [Tetrabaena socialis]|uniref:phytol kinase n=1 Tax=Tetrabaena socialis TaxID=47790 RepID=A0A2J8A2A3_9CHLO|nr:hypothetical protein TSOC_006940 [Tetrabaena socialis]|eukprot:PNH06644.1 hypothetical protein TSOC_006940 [Tetrabaena socialis]